MLVARHVFGVDFRCADAVRFEWHERGWRWTYGFLPVFEGADENDDVWDMALFRWVHGIKVEG